MHVLNRFDTGYSILRTLLCEEQAICNQIYSQLPLSGLWSSLICLACQVTGKERLKILSLLMRLVHLFKTPASQSTDYSAMVTGLERLNLSALNPLWQLYTKLIKDYGQQIIYSLQDTCNCILMKTFVCICAEEKVKTYAPEIIRAMTELFFVVENLAEVCLPTLLFVLY